MYTPVKADLIRAALEAPTVEVCALLYANGDQLAVHPCRNVAPDPSSEFDIGVEDQIAAMRKGELHGTFHSHPSANSFSEADLEYADELGLPYYLYSVTNQRWHEYIPSSYEPQLEGRPFVLGTHDCFGLVRDYYRLRLGHYITDYDRDENFLRVGKTAVMDNFEKEGFQKIEPRDAKVHDILLFYSDKALPLHFGILVGPSRLLHHPRGLLSTTETITERWLSRLICAFRLNPPPK